MNLKMFGFKIKAIHNKKIKSANPNHPIIHSINRSITFTHNKHPNPPVNRNGTKNQKSNNIKILQSPNPSILQFFNLSILQSFFLLVFLFSLFSINYGQVKIKEKVEIKPENIFKSTKFQNSITSIHTLNSEIKWDTTGGTKNYIRNKIIFEIKKCENDTLESEYYYDGLGSLSYSTDTAASIIVKTNPQGNNYPIDNSWFDDASAHGLKIVVDGSIIYDDTLASHNHNIRPWRSDLEFNLNNSSLCPQEETTFYVGDSNNTCGIIKWNENDKITVSIIQGQQYVSFYNMETEEYIGKTLFDTENLLSNYNLKYDNAATSEQDIIIEATVAGESKRDTIRINPISSTLYVKGEIKDGVENIVHNEKLTITSWLEGVGICGGNIESSDSSTYTATIIQGDSLGELINVFNNSRGDTLKNIIAINNKITIDFYANEKEPKQEEEVKVQISNSKPNTVPWIATFFVDPSGIKVLFEPDNLQPGDTANVLLKHIKEDGSLEDFPEDQEFEVELLDSSGKYGTILSSNGVDTSDYFSPVNKGIKFIAKSIIDTNSAEVRLKANTSFFPATTASLKNTTTSSKGTNNITWVVPITGIGKANVVKSCEDYACDDNTFQTPQFLIKEIKNENYTEFDFAAYNLAGLFHPLFEEVLYDYRKDPVYIYHVKPDEISAPIDVTTCYNTAENFWQYSLPGNLIFINAILDRFRENIDPDYEFIESFDQLNNLSNEQACIALKDFERQKNYGATVEKYYLWDVTELHEGAHKERFVALIKKALKKTVYVKKLDQTMTYEDYFTIWEPQCEDYPNPEKAKQFWEKHLNNVVNKFLKQLKVDYDKQKEDTKKNEYDTHHTTYVQKRIKDYIKYLKFTYPFLKNKKSCN